MTPKNKARVYATTSMLTVAGLVTAAGAPWKWAFSVFF